MNNPLKKRGSNLESLLHTEQQITIEKMAVGGSGVGRIEFDGKKIVVFIAYAAPEDILKVRITTVEKNFLIGEILEILTESPHRQKAPCVYFGRCGGCLWQHLTDSAQILQKEIILIDLFQKFLPDVGYVLENSIATAERFGYRNRVQLKQSGLQQGNLLGYFEHESHKIVDIDRCLIAEELINTAIAEYKAKMRPVSELQKIEFRINQNNAIEIKKIGQKSEGVAFSQVNRFVNSKLVETVVRLINNEKPKKILELYAGSGNFTFPFAQLESIEHITAVEWDSELTKLAVEKIKTQKLHKKMTFFTSKCETFCNSLNENRPSDAQSDSFDVVFLDPPRAGCHSDVIDKTLQLSPTSIFYVACHPVSLARDLKPLIQKYKIEYLQIFDMFPQTDHFETLCLLKKRDS